MERTCKTDIDFFWGTKTIKVLKNDKWKVKTYKITSNTKEMRQNYKEQLRQAITVLGNYKREINMLKNIESVVVEQLKAKGADIEDPNLDVRKVFIVERKQKAKSINKCVTSQNWSKHLKPHKRNFDYHLSTKKEREVNVESQSFNAEMVGEVSMNHDLDIVFEREQQKNNEHEIEINAPYIPQTIAQVFL